MMWELGKRTESLGLIGYDWEILIWKKGSFFRFKSDGSLDELFLLSCRISSVGFYFGFIFSGFGICVLSSPGRW